MFPRLTIAALLLMSLAAAQQPPEILITPNRATLIVGQNRLFRAVGADGRPLSGVSWYIEGESGRMETKGDEVTVWAVKEGEFSVRGEISGRSAVAEVTVSTGLELPPGTLPWDVDPLPGLEIEDRRVALKAANGPIAFQVEGNSTGRFIRAFTADGREMWRNGSYIDPERDPNDKTPKKPLCDSVKKGMTREQVLKTARDARVYVPPELRSEQVWYLRELKTADINDGVIDCQVVFSQTEDKVSNKLKQPRD